MEDYRGGDKTNKIYISNLNYSTTQDDLRKNFEQFGKIISINLKQKDTGITFAFIQYESIKDAERAIDQISASFFNSLALQLRMNRKKVDEKELKVEFARGRGRDRGGDRNYRGGDRYDRGGFRGGERRDNNTKGCFNCNKEGHFARECPQPKKPREYDNRDRGGYSRGRDRDYRRSDNQRRRSSSGSKNRSRSRSGDRRKNKHRKRNSSNSSSSR